MPNVGEERFPLPYLRRWTSEHIKRRLFDYQLRNVDERHPLPGNARLKNLARHLQRYVNIEFGPSRTEFSKTMRVERERPVRGTASEFEDALIDWVDSRNKRWRLARLLETFDETATADRG